MPPLSSVAPAKGIPNSRSEFRSDQKPRLVSRFCGISRKERSARRAPADEVTKYHLPFKNYQCLHKSHTGSGPKEVKEVCCSPCRSCRCLIPSHRLVLGTPGHRPDQGHADRLGRAVPGNVMRAPSADGPPPATRWGGSWPPASPTPGPNHHKVGTKPRRIS